MAAVSDILKIAERAIYLQEGGASPASAPRYRGETNFGGWNIPQGDLNPVFLPSRDRPNTWDIVDVTQGSQGLPTSDFTARTNFVVYKIWRRIIKARCPVIGYVKHDDCGRPDDPNSWLYKKLYEDSYFTDFSDAQDGTLQGDDQTPVELTGSITAMAEHILYPIAFKEVADAAIVADMIDGFYANVASCGGRCGAREDECHNFYGLAAVNTGSPGLSSQLILSTDDKVTWNSLDIPTLGGVGADAIDDAGSYIVLVSRNEAAHHYIKFTDADDLDPTGWAQITTNYVGSNYDIFALSPEEIYIAGEAGYAYRLDEPTGAPTILTDGSIVTDNLMHVDGHVRTVVFAGDAGKVLITENRGESLIERAITLAIDDSVIIGDVQALGVLSDNIWFLAVAGTLYYTLDKGLTYTEKAIDSNISVINDIRFTNALVGYICAEVSGAGTVYRTHNAGYSWHNSTPDIDGIPTTTRFNFAAPCGVNEVAAGGRVSVGGDGLLAIAT